jgi:tetratricopeptide (TPR) repeat protein
MGSAYFNLSDKKKAIEYYQKAIDIKPDDHKSWFSIGWIRLLESNFHKGKRTFTKNLELTEQQHDHTAMNLGHVFLLGEQNKNEALKWYQKSMLLRDEKETFFKDMESDFKDLKMEEQGISREEYDHILDTLKTANE